jgi:hypothetical protein
MFMLKRQFVAVAVLVLVCSSALVWAHQMTLKGVVAAVEPTRIQVKTGEEKKGVAPEWCAIDDKTKIFRDKTVVTFGVAKIVVNEKIVVLSDHDSDNKMTAIEIHLAAK